MKVKTIAVYAALFAAASLLSAKDAALPLPPKGTVTLVGRVFFSSDIDKNFLFDSAAVPQEKRNLPDLCFLPFFDDKVELVKKKTAPASDNIADILKMFDSMEKKKTPAGEIKKFSMQAKAFNGQWFFVQYKYNADRIICLTDATLFIGKSPRLPVILPMNCKLVVPEGEQFLYVGDFHYSAKGFAFELSKKIVDSFDEAQVALNQAAKKDVKLCRANVEPYDKERDGGIQHMYDLPTVSFSSWYETFK